MSEGNRTIRGRIFGGFDRQDVLRCMEEMDQAHRKELEEARAALAAEQQARQELERTVAEQGAQSAETRRLTAALEQSETALRAARQELDRKSQRLDQLERETAALREQTERLRPSAEAYEAVKDRTAGIELDAHRRAEEITRRAEDRAAKLRADTLQWLNKLSRGYDLLRTDMDATVSHTVDELERVERSLRGASADFETYDRRLAELIQAYQEGKD